MSDTALRLADAIDSDFDPDWMNESGYDEIAAELRRLHDLVTEDSILLRRQRDEIAQLKALNAELVEALRGIVEFVDGPVQGQRPDVWAKRVDQARAALAKVQGNIK